MERAILVVFMSGLVTAGCAPPSLADQIGERVLIRNGFTVPAGKLLLVDDMSVDCVIASEVLDEQEFPEVGVEATGYLRICIRSTPVRKPSTPRANARHRTTWSAPEPRVG